MSETDFDKDPQSLAREIILEAAESSGVWEGFQQYLDSGAFGPDGSLTFVADIVEKCRAAGIPEVNLKKFVGRDVIGRANFWYRYREEFRRRVNGMLNHL